MIRPPLISTLFPYTTLFRSAREGRGFDRSMAAARHARRDRLLGAAAQLSRFPDRRTTGGASGLSARGSDAARVPPRRAEDRKSTRLNSSHLGISYAVFCLKK